MNQLRQAIITFDPERIAQVDPQAEGFVFTSMVRRALIGEEHPAERGIVSIDLLDPAADIMIRPARLD